MKVSYIKDHSLILAVSEVDRSYIQKCDPHNEKNDPYATQKENYAIEVFMHISNIISCLDQLYFSIGLLSGYRKSSTPKYMNRHAWSIWSDQAGCPIGASLGLK
jgi:hypothetical protein